MERLDKPYKYNSKQLLEDNQIDQISTSLESRLNRSSSLLSNESKKKLSNRVKFKKIQESLVQLKTERDGDDGGLSENGVFDINDKNTRRSLCSNLMACCPKCYQFSAREGSENRMKCSFCKVKWCWICRQYFKDRKTLDEHFAFYSIFGCPGLSRTPNLFIFTLFLNVLYALLFPVTLLFAPMILMIKNYQGPLLVSDQA